MGRLARALGGDRLEGAADALLNDILKTNRYGKSREMEYVFPDKLTLQTMLMKPSHVLVLVLLLS